jgi:hypothetical protein
MSDIDGGAEGTGYEIDPDLQAEAEMTLAKIEHAGCEQWDTLMESVIGQVRGILDGLDDPADLRDHIDTLAWWLDTDVYRPPLPPEQQFRDQFCIRRPCRGCKRIYKRCMKP